MLGTLIKNISGKKFDLPSIGFLPALVTMKSKNFMFIRG